MLNSPNEKSAMPNGRIKAYNSDRGFGFISRGQDRDLFFHISDVINPDEIKIGASVTFETQDSAKGLRAAKVSILPA